MLPEINSPVINETPKLGKSFLFNFEKNELVIKDGKLIEIEGLDVIKQWIQFTLRTEKYRYLIYQDYGVEIEDLMNNGLKSKLLYIELERTIKEALEVHEYIQSVNNFGFKQQEDILTITFTVALIDGLSFGGGIDVRKPD
jgi:phage baseplate assembly protein W